MFSNWIDAEAHYLLSTHVVHQPCSNRVTGLIDAKAHLLSVQVVHQPCSHKVTNRISQDKGLADIAFCRIVNTILNRGLFREISLTNELGFCTLQ